MNRLRGSRCYLCGAMDRVKDGGVEWRQRIRQELKRLNLQWLDPTDKPCDIGKEGPENRRIRKVNKAAGRYEIVAREMREIRCVDLRMIDICDFLVVNLDIDVHCCGTYEEVFLANRQKKPVLIHVEQGKTRTPDWLIGTLPHQHIFSEWADLFHYLKRLDKGEFDDPTGRWYFFDWMG